MLRRMELIVDETDYRKIQASIARRQRWMCLPDADEAGANLAGRVLAEICRGWEEYRDAGPRETLDDGEEWKTR